MPDERFEVDFTRAAEKDLRSLRRWSTVVMRQLARLETGPDAGHALTGSLLGSRSLEFNLKGSGAYRAVYITDPQRQIRTVFLIGPRVNIYCEAERRIRILRKAGDIPDSQ